MRMTCQECRFFDQGSALAGQSANKECHFSPPTALPTPTPAGIKIFPVRPPTAPEAVACKDFQAAEVN